MGEKLRLGLRLGFGVGGGARRFSGAALRNEQGGLALPNRIRRRQRFVLGGLQAGQSGVGCSVGVGPQGVQIDQFQQIQLLLGGGILGQVSP